MLDLLAWLEPLALAIGVPSWALVLLLAALLGF